MNESTSSPTACSEHRQGVPAKRPMDDWESVRAEAARRSEQCALPTESQELWRYTTPDTCGVHALASLATPVDVRWSIAPFSKPGSGGARSELPRGVSFTDELLAEGAELALAKSLLLDTEPYLPDHAEHDAFSDAVAYLQLAKCERVGILRVARDTVVTEPLALSRHLRESASAFCSTLVVIVESGASVTLVDDDATEPNAAHFSRIECLVEQRGRLSLISRQERGETARAIARQRVTVKRGAEVQLFHCALGSQGARLDLECRLIEEGAQADLYSLYLADGDRHQGLYPVQLHCAPGCRSNLFYKGVVRDQARASYFGFVRVAEGAQRTDGYQKNHVLLLSSEARADSIPNLEIKANDVRCSHGSTVGQIGAEEIFYLMSRGLTRALAEQLLVEAFFDVLLARIPHEALREQLHQRIIERIHYGRSCSVPR